MEIYAYSTLLILIVGFLLQFKYYGYRIILHPSFWFYLVWILSVISFIIFINVGMTYIIFDRSLIEELLVYVSFTALCFMIVNGYSYKKISKQNVKWKPKFLEEHFKVIATTIFIIAFVTFLVGSGFDFIKNREIAVNNARSFVVNKNTASAMDIITSVFYGLNLPMLILSGFYIGKNYYLRFTKKADSKFPYYYFFPFITTVISTIISGGRAGIVISIIFLIFGLSLGLFRYNDVPSKLIFKLLRYGVLIFITFSLFTTYVNVLRVRNNIGAAQSVSKWASYPILQPISGLLEYLTDHYPGYQLRRLDSVSPDLAYGQISLSGITMFTVPIASQVLGIPISIQSMLNLKAPNTITSSMRLQSLGAGWTYTTATVYFNLYCDFGYWGTFGAILVFVIFTQIIFNSIFMKPRYTFLSLLPYTLIYFLWSQTIFSHVILGSWMTAFIYPFIVADFISSFRKVIIKRKELKYEQI